MQLPVLLTKEHLLVVLSLVWSAYLVVVGIWILLQRRAPAATLGWLLSMAVLPVVGLLVYYVFGPQRLQRQRQRRLRSRRRSRLRASAGRLRHHVPQAHGQVRQIANLIMAAARQPVSTAYEVDLLVGGSQTFDHIIAAIQEAKYHVHLEYYIFEPDHTGERLLDALTARAQAGVQVRLLVDGLGSKRLLPRHYQRLVDAGGQVARFHPVRFGQRLRPVINFRTHRKIVIIDGTVGYTGGVNITDEEDKRLHPGTAYHDVHLRLCGPVVNWLQTVFLEDWHYALDYASDWHVPVDGPHRHPSVLPAQMEGAQPVQIMASGPDSSRAAIYRVYVEAIQSAQRRLWLTTPYFVPTEAAMLALTSAALRGVDVRLLVPQRSDSRLVTAAARSYFDELISMGVKVYEYRASMLHSKTLLVDNMVSIVGTANFDTRSFLLNYEVCAVVYGEKFAAQLQDQFVADLDHAERVPYARPQSFAQRLGDSLARLYSPLL